MGSRGSRFSHFWRLVDLQENERVDVFAAVVTGVVLITVGTVVLGGVDLNNFVGLG